MKSIKPGRGPSFMGGVGSVAVIFFGLIWTFAVASMGAPFFFPLFGVVFIIVGVVQAMYHFKNATGKQRFSAFDITDDNEEADPLNERFGVQKNVPTENSDDNNDDDNGNFCPYCGSPVKADYEFCRQCGKKI